MAVRQSPIRVPLVPTPDPGAPGSARVIRLDEGWQLNLAPGGAPWDAPSDAGTWHPVAVPGEPAMQGFDVAFDSEFAYRLDLADPVREPGDRVVLRFDGVYSAARVWVNGEPVGEHVGGFTRFEFEIADCLAPGPNRIVVGVTDRSDSVSTASHYAFHPIGGILRPVSLVVLPPDHLARLHISTPIEDAASGRGRLHLDFDAVAGDAELHLELRDPDGGPVSGWDDHVVPIPGSGSYQLEFPLRDLQLWSDESPRLYALSAVLRGEREVRYTRRVGFRSVRVEGNRLLLNDQPVLLRGINRHDLHPRLGRASDGSLERRDLELFRDANINFVRTSHYPPPPELLEAADELGILVEVENGVCWAGQFGWPATQDEPRFAEEYLGPLAEMVELHRNHASVVIWSIGNESTWGENFRRSFDQVAASDPTRPVIMSFEGGPEHILSSHYPAYGSDPGSAAKPVLHDEIVHLPVYQSAALRRDPGVHADWARTLDDFMVRLRASEGGAGLAVWSGVDEQFLLPEGIRGFGPWGIIDIWRRRKPEWWGMRAAYSPVRLDVDRAAQHGDSLRVPVVNHLRTQGLTDYRFEWRRPDSGASGVIGGLDIAPGREGAVVVPAGTGNLELRVIAPDGRVVDERALIAPAGTAPVLGTTALSAIEGEGQLVVANGDSTFVVRLDSTTGRLIECSNNGGAVITGPIEPQVDERVLGEWRSTGFAWHAADDQVTVTSTGRAGGFELRLGLVIRERGIRVDFELDGPAAGRVQEAGVAVPLTSEAAWTQWESAPPLALTDAAYLGRHRGTASRDAAPDPRVLGEGPALWMTVDSGAIDASFADRWSRDFRAGRSHVRTQAVTDATGAGLTLVARSPLATRLSPRRAVLEPDAPAVRRAGDWQLREVAGGLNQGGNGVFDFRAEEPGSSLTVAFSGESIDCLGALGPDLGIVSVSVDGVVVAPAVDLFSPVDCAGHTFFTASGLFDTEHELCVTLTGMHHPWSRGAAARVRAFEVFRPAPETVLNVLAERHYPYTGSFDWVDPAEVAAGARIHAKGSFDLRF
jgi:beta-galactosidase